MPTVPAGQRVIFAALRIFLEIVYNSTVELNLVAADVQVRAISKAAGRIASIGAISADVEQALLLASSSVNSGASLTSHQSICFNLVRRRVDFDLRSAENSYTVIS